MNDVIYKLYLNIIVEIILKVMEPEREPMGDENLYDSYGVVKN